MKRAIWYLTIVTAVSFALVGFGFAATISLRATPASTIGCGVKLSIKGQELKDGVAMAAATDNPVTFTMSDMAGTFKTCNNTTSCSGAAAIERMVAGENRITVMVQVAGCATPTSFGIISYVDLQ